MLTDFRRDSVLLVACCAFIPFSTSTPVQRRSCLDSIVKLQGLPPASGYSVEFDPSRGPWTLSEHKAVTGLDISTSKLDQHGYTSLDLKESQLSDVCKDDRVNEITQSTFSKPNHSERDLDNDSTGNLTLSPTLHRRGSMSDVGWGLTYLSEKSKFSSPPAGQLQNYYYLKDGGDGVDIHIIDSGINKIEAFGKGDTNRVIWPKGVASSDTLDHGTKVASFAGSDKLGSAKKANLYAWKIDNPGDRSQQAVDAVKKVIEIDKERRTQAGYKGAVINVSSSLENSASLELAINTAIRKGIAVVAAAGNDGIEGKEYPCSYEDVICVGAISDNYDIVTKWKNGPGGSNYGKRLTLFAPGIGLSGFDMNNVQQDDLEGTSFATPYVSGIIATFYSYQGTQGKYSDVTNARKLLLSNAEMSILGSGATKAGGPNTLANNGFWKAPNGLPYVGAPDKPAPFLRAMEAQPVVCNDPASEPGHANLFAYQVKTLAVKACSEPPKYSPPMFMTADSKPIAQTLQDGVNINYFYSISWIPECILTTETEDPYEPLGAGQKTCSDFMYQAYTDCNNGGIGGTIDVGCLRYEYTGGK